MWLVPSSAQSDSAPGSECLTRGCIPLSTISESNLGLWVTSSGTPSLRQASWHGWKNRAWSQRLFGPATLKMSDGNPGMAAWISSWRDSPASPGAPRASKKALTTPVGYGLPLQTPFAVRERGAWHSKTCADLFQEAGLTPFLGSWPTWGSLLNGELFQQPAWAPATGGKESSSSQPKWDTPDCCPDAPNSGSNRTAQIAGLGNQAKAMWPSARAEDSESCGNHPGATDSLNGAIKQWLTPRATDTQSGEGSETFVKRMGDRTAACFQSIPAQVAQWQTPAVDSFRSRGGERKDEMGLDQQGRTWPTPASRDEKGENSESYQARGGGMKGEQLPNYVTHYFSRPDQQTHDGEQSSPETPALRRRLNPAFVCWLMGWPSHWTRAEPTSYGARETALWRSKLRQRLSSLRKG